MSPSSLDVFMDKPTVKKKTKKTRERLEAKPVTPPRKSKEPKPVSKEVETQWSEEHSEPTVGSNGFSTLKLRPELLKALAEMNFETPSPIQAAAIPVLLDGKDVIGQAQTGSGKTAAFALPLIQELAEPGLQALILCPTRELVQQVTEQVRLLMQHVKDHRVVSVYGGEDIRRQLKLLQREPSIIVGTPGRTMDLMRRRAIDLSDVKQVVLDEADEMLDMGFREDMETILSEATNPNRQTVLFSATMDRDILRLAKTFQKSPVVIDVSDQQRSQPKIEQFFSVVPERHKMEGAFRLLIANRTQCAVVFCNTKAKVDEFVDFLRDRNLAADALHGGVSQEGRTRIMNAFRQGHIRILVATDVAGRGMDVSNLDMVVNVDLPRDNEDYIHRVGRTGRAGKAGKAYTLVNAKQRFVINKICRTYGVTVQPLSIPNAETITQLQLKAVVDQTESKLQDPENHEALIPFIKQLKRLTADGTHPLHVAAALLQQWQEQNQSFADARLDSVFEARPERNQSFEGGARRGGGRPYYRDRQDRRGPKSAPRRFTKRGDGQ